MYRSPLHILGEWNADISSVNDVYLLRLRKQLLAEFGLTNSPTIEIKGKQYSKDEVIKTIDELLDNPRLPLHVFIYSNKDVLDFLENDNAVPKYHIIKALTVPEDLKDSFNPLMIERFAIQLKKGFSKKDFHGLKEVLINLPAMDDESKAAFDEELHRNVSNLTEQIENVKDHHPEKTATELPFLKQDALASFLNKLPEEMDGVKDSLVAMIINTLVAYQKIRRHDKNYIYTVSKMLCKLTCDEELMRLIKSNHAIFKSSFEGVTTSSSDSSSGGSFSGGNAIYLVIVVIVFIIRIATCSHRSSSDRYHFDTSSLNSLHIKDKRSETDKFFGYRKYVLEGRMNRITRRGYYDPVEMSNFMNGVSPYKFTKIDPDNIDVYPTDQQVKIVNNSGKQLIVTCVNGSRVNSYFFLKGLSDTLNIGADGSLYLYFGDSLVRNKAFDKLSSSISYYTEMAEPFFSDLDSLGTSIFDSEFKIEILKPAKKTKKKSKKAKQVPQLEFTPEFFKTQSIENEKVLMYKHVVTGEFIPAQ